MFGSRARFVAAGRLVAIGLVLSATLAGCAPSIENHGPSESFNALTLPAKYTGSGTITTKFNDQSCDNSGNATATISATGAFELIIALPGSPILAQGNVCSFYDGGAYAAMAEAKNVLTDSQFYLTGCNQGALKADGSGDFLANSSLQVNGNCRSKDDGTMVFTFRATLAPSS